MSSANASADADRLASSGRTLMNDAATRTTDHATATTVSGRNVKGTQAAANHGAYW